MMTWFSTVLEQKIRLLATNFKKENWKKRATDLKKTSGVFQAVSVPKQSYGRLALGLAPNQRALAPDGRLAIMGLVLNQGFNNRWAISNHGISAKSEGFSDRWAISNHGISAESGLQQQMGD
jgi:hypothetical protein